ncbi:MAG: Rieske 2Fe-2S domain-containing protein [Proteobacteria bacterium]|nr:Rieske 2Fe-2S domain-containing protein [Pseudomonadota bacterium]
MASANAFPLVRNGWYVAAPSLRLRTQRLACRVLDHDIVLFRDAAGAPHALLDRCCHRPARAPGRVSQGIGECP